MTPIRKRRILIIGIKKITITAAMALQLKKGGTIFTKARFTIQIYTGKFKKERNSVNIFL
jgi:hypothetical protein